jgi:hypothetical protein
VGRECLKGTLIFLNVWDLLNDQGRLDVASPRMNLEGRTASSDPSSRWNSPRLETASPFSSSHRGVRSRRQRFSLFRSFWGRFCLTLHRLIGISHSHRSISRRGSGNFSSRGTKDFLGSRTSGWEVFLRDHLREFASEEFKNRPDDLRSRISDPDEEEGDLPPPSSGGVGVASVFQHGPILLNVPQGLEGPTTLGGLLLRLKDWAHCFDD